MTPEKIDAMAREALRLMHDKVDPIDYLRSIIDEHGHDTCQQVMNRACWIIINE